MQEIERSIEDLVSSTHAKQNWSGGVVQSNDGVAALPHELVTSLALKKTSVEMNPMATHICNRIFGITFQICKCYYYSNFSMFFTNQITQAVKI